MENFKGQLIRFKSNLTKGKTLIGYVDKVDDYLRVWYPKNGEYSIGISPSRVVESWDVVIHEPKKKELAIGFSWKPKERKITEGMLVKYNSLGDIIYGVTTDSFSLENFNGKSAWRCYWSDGTGKCTPWVFESEILEAWDIIIHEPQEVGLKEAQESANHGYLAVQGIIEAHKDKEEPSEVPPFKKVLMGFDEFDKSVQRTWKDQNFVDAVSNAALGLTGESGEVADLVKKAIYHDRGFDATENGKEYHGMDVTKRIKVSDVKDELSDVLYYVSAMAQTFGFTLEDVARHNKAKLEKRYKEGFTVKESAEKRDKHSLEFRTPTPTEGRW